MTLTSRRVETNAVTRTEFQQWADLLPDALILLSRRGDVMAVNRAARQEELISPEAIDGPLQQSVTDSPEKLQEYFRHCARSREPLAGSLTFRQRTSRVRCSCGLLRPADGEHEALLLLRIPKTESKYDHFTLLNEKLASLAEEVERRKHAERDLRRQHDLASFGRDIGMILVEADSISQMLQRCTESIVTHLDATFARIWTLDAGADELVLRASAGLYTHLDGEHSRIRVGEYKIGAIAQEQVPVLTNSVIGDTRVHNQEWARETGIIAFAGYPLIVDQRTVGVMALFAKRKVTDATADALASIASSVSLGIERKTIESSLRDHAGRLEAADRRKDEFLAMLAHELRNPLAPIRSGLELLLLEPGANSETLQLMNQNVRHMVRLVDDLLDISRIMRDRIQVKKQPVDFSEMTRRAIQSIEADSSHRRHELIVDECDTPLWIDADAVRISQVLINLLNNAIKYTPDEGRIWVTTSKQESRAVLTIRDSGIGIEPEFLPHVFDLFAQADQSLDRSAGGLGIGLTLAHRLVKMHRGSLTVASDGRDRGSTFTIQFPLVAAPPAEGSAGVAAETVRPIRILVVDDSVGSAKMLKRLLGAIGQEDVALAHDGPSAIEVAQSIQPDLILLDIGLPGLDGYQVARKLRCAPEQPAPFIVALTGYGNEDARRQSAAAGIQKHLVKPVSLEQLQAVLNAVPSAH